MAADVTALAVTPAAALAQAVVVKSQIHPVAANQLVHQPAAMAAALHLAVVLNRLVHLHAAMAAALLLAVVAKWLLAVVAKPLAASHVVNLCSSCSMHASTKDITWPITSKAATAVTTAVHRLANRPVA
jgi:hypothetical protein